jgi:hypothetical protein
MNGTFTLPSGPVVRTSGVSFAPSGSGTMFWARFASRSSADFAGFQVCSEALTGVAGGRWPYS